ncbi:hypothetical protein AB0910_29540, partial [Streptomyces sp. NPDC047002]
YVGKAGRFTVVKVADVFKGLRGAGGRITLPAGSVALPDGTVKIPIDTPTHLPDTAVRLPASAGAPIHLPDAGGGRSAVLDPETGRLYGPDGHELPAPKEPTAAERADGAQITPPDTPTPEPALTGAPHTTHAPGGTADHLPQGTHTPPHTPTAAHTPPTRGHQPPADHTPTDHTPTGGHPGGATGPHDHHSPPARESGSGAEHHGTSSHGHGSGHQESGASHEAAPTTSAGHEPPRTGHEGAEIPGEGRPLLVGSETETRLRDAVKHIPGNLRPKQKAIDVAIERLSHDPRGRQVADIIASGRFNGSDRWGQLVSSLGSGIQGHYVPATDQIIFADELHKSGIPADQISFEQSSPSGADVDVHVRDESGTYAYQMKHLNNPKEPFNEITRAKYLRQIRLADADHRIMLVDGQGTVADWQERGIPDELMDIHNGGSNGKGTGVTFVVRLDDGTIVIPPGSRTDPKGIL